MAANYVKNTRTPTATDASVGTHEHDGKKLYQLDGYEDPQQLGYGFRIIKRGNGHCLQKQYTGKPRGENTQTVWADIAVHDEAGNFVGYEF